MGTPPCHHHAFTGTSGDPSPQRGLQVPFSADQRPKLGPPPTAGQEQYFCLQGRSWGVPCAQPEGLAHPRVLPDPQTHGGQGKPEGALLGGAAPGNTEQLQVRSPRCLPLGHRPPANSWESQASSVLRVPCLCPPQPGLCCPGPCWDFPDTLPTQRPHIHLCTVLSPSQKQGVCGFYSLLYHKCLELLVPHNRRSIKVCGTDA